MLSVFVSVLGFFLSLYELSLRLSKLRDGDRMAACSDGAALAVGSVAQRLCDAETRPATLDALDSGVWGRAKTEFDKHTGEAA